MTGYRYLHLRPWVFCEWKFESKSFNFSNEKRVFEITTKIISLIALDRFIICFHIACILYTCYKLKLYQLNFANVNCSCCSFIYLPYIDLQCITRHSRELEPINIQWIQIFDITHTGKWSLYIYSCEQKHSDRHKVHFFRYLQRDGNWTQIEITSVLIRTPVIPPGQKIQRIIACFLHIVAHWSA